MVEKTNNYVFEDNTNPHSPWRNICKSLNSHTLYIYYFLLEGIQKFFCEEGRIFTKKDFLWK